MRGKRSGFQKNIFYARPLFVRGSFMVQLRSVYVLGTLRKEDIMYSQQQMQHEFIHNCQLEHQKAVEELKKVSG